MAAQTDVERPVRQAMIAGAASGTFFDAQFTRSGLSSIREGPPK